MREQIRKHHQYIHGGGYFSKLLFLAGSVEKKNILHVSSNTEIQKKFLTLAHDLKIPYKKLESYHDLYELKVGSGTLYSAEVSFFESFLEKKILTGGFCISQGESISMDECVKRLGDIGYEFHQYEKISSFSRYGDLIKIISPDNNKICISFWGDEIEEIQINMVKIPNISFVSLEKISEKNKTVHSMSVQEYISNEGIAYVLDMLEFHYLYETLSDITRFEVSSFDILSQPEKWEQSIDLGVQEIVYHDLESLKQLLSLGTKNIEIYSRYPDMLEEFLENNHLPGRKIYPVKSHIYTSFSYENNFYICDDIIEKIFIKKRVKKKLSADIDLLLKIQTGDYIVHIDHGIGLFDGIIKKTLAGREQEYLKISYKDDESLFVPITQLQRVSKYVGSENPKLTPLGGKIWEKKIKKVHEDIREIAQNILENFAQRKIRQGEKNIFLASEMQLFQQSFSYPYTQDQENAIQEIMQDMLSDKNMDRLLVGDVGFGKTEVAFNALQLAILNHKQVIFISPLIVLAHEHYEKAKERFAGWGYNIEILTRLQSQAHANRVLRGLASGKIHIVIGTHRLLSEKINYKNLGLMIVDEEHKFGVADKEKIKNIKADIDILSLSATPIPRSLNLALSGVRDISLIKTAPSGRKAIETSVLRYNESLIQQAGVREFERGGQVFFVHNRVSNIEVVKKQLQNLFPKKKIIITHGQLPGDELENRIMDFKHKKYDILLSTTVIENGIDFSNVNTIFINECQSFGISQIHQLRGRVGRSQRQGYCYLLYRKEHIDTDAARRMQTIVDYNYLGAGFELAMKDLEIRGGGDILGIKQSGQSSEVGVALFLKMLEEKISELKEETNNTAKLIHKPSIECSIDIPLSASIPDSFFLSQGDKLNFYRELEYITDIGDIEYLENSLFSGREKQHHEEIENLFLLLELKILAQSFQITHIKKTGIHYQIDFHQDGLEQLKTFLSRDNKIYFIIAHGLRLRCLVKTFANDKMFLQYVLQLLTGKVHHMKIRLKKKAKI